MHLLALSALLLPATALRLSDIQHSGPACPASSGLGVSITGVFPDVRVTIPGVSAAAERPMPVSSACEIGVTVDGGKAGQSLVLESVDVWGALGLAAGAKGRLITTAFWAETADDLVGLLSFLPLIVIATSFVASPVFRHRFTLLCRARLSSNHSNHARC